MGETAAVSLAREPGWICRRSWDLPFLIFSAVLVPVPLVFTWATVSGGLLSEQQAIDIVNLVVAGLIGGPHLFSTFTVTLLNRRFVRRYPLFTAGAVVFPPLVIWLGLENYPLLVFLFFTWASIHLLHQIVYICECYRVRLAVAEPAWSVWTDRCLILLGLYPVALWKLSTGAFRVGGVTLQLPEFLRPFPLWQLTAGAFAAVLAVWLCKTAAEAARGTLNGPKTLLIGTTTLISFCIPLGQNLDVLFQGYNTWHSFQYLFLFWLVNRLRLERGEIDHPLVRKIVAPASILPYYAAFLSATVLMMGVVVLVRFLTPLGPDRSYFVVVLSVLWVHYYFDHLLFTRTEYVL